jgi:hypothetical protein
MTAIFLAPVSTGFSGSQLSTLKSDGMSDFERQEKYKKNH